MAFSPFSGGNSGGNDQTPKAPEQPDVAALLQKQQEEIQKVNQRLQEQAQFHNRQIDAANQKVELLKSQLTEVVKPSIPAPAKTATETDDWLAILGGDNTPQHGNQQAVLTPEAAKKAAQDVYYAERNREQRVYQEEAAKVAALNERFAIEHPDLVKDQAAVILIKNQFENLTRLRPDLSAETRYSMAIENANSLLPAVRPAQTKEAGEEMSVRKRSQPNANPYMPSQAGGVGGAPPKQDNSKHKWEHPKSMEERMQEHAADIQRRKMEYAKMQFGG